ncbi:MAG: hypothetical protein MK211_11880 [Flavobacteriales bacterium]|jgi:hypothetical protein|nr:hypothetical protein [Flavobacteriales bacterium]
MLPKTNIQKVLEKVRSRRIAEETLIAEVERIFSENTSQRKQITERLKNNIDSTNAFAIDILEADRIFHLQDIKKLCITYRLRFLDSGYFKGTFPEEAISKIRCLEQDHKTTLNNFKIVAPAKLLKLENADDPLLFAPMGNEYYYLIHKWGNDLHPLRKALMWPYKCFENLVFTIFLLSIFLTAITPIHLFSQTTKTQEYLLLFLFMFKAVGGIVLFYGFAKGKNFNTAIWNSNYYNA